MTDEKKPGKILRKMFKDLFPFEDYDKQRSTENVCKILNYYYGENKYTDSDGIDCVIYNNRKLCWCFTWGVSPTSGIDELGIQLLEFLNKEILIFKLELVSN